MGLGSSFGATSVFIIVLGHYLLTPKAECADMRLKNTEQWPQMNTYQPGPGTRSSPDLTPPNIQSGFISQAGDFYVYAAPYTYEIFTYSESGRRSSSEWQGDASFGGGVGLGSMDSLAAVELSASLGGIYKRPGSGGVDIRIGRTIFKSDTLQAGVSLGALNIVSFGQDSSEPSYYVAASAAVPISFEGSKRTLLVNLGRGTGRYQAPDSGYLLKQGIFGSVGVEVGDGAGLSVGLGSGEVSLLGSFAPLPGKPLKMNLTVGNIFDHDQRGRTISASLTWGGRFSVPRF